MKMLLEVINQQFLKIQRIMITYYKIINNYNNNNYFQYKIKVNNLMLFLILLN